MKFLQKLDRCRDGQGRHVRGSCDPRSFHLEKPHGFPSIAKWLASFSIRLSAICLRSSLLSFHIICAYPNCHLSICLKQDFNAEHCRGQELCQYWVRKTEEKDGQFGISVDTVVSEISKRDGFNSYGYKHDVLPK